jgi:ubiquinone/menaquinone biosynthesis C-methylase UbiE
VSVDRDVFTSGWYAERFRPDDRGDPFHRIYAEKRDGVLAMLGTLPEGSEVLDLGGGMGRIALPLTRRHLVTLSDISTDMLDMARATAARGGLDGDRLTLRRVDANETLPFETGSFSAALAIDLIVHLSDPVATLRELRRVLEPGGMLVVDTTNRRPWWALRYPRYVGRRPGRWYSTLRGGGVLPEWQKIVRHQTRAEFRRMLADAGFVPVEERRFGPPGCPKWFVSRCSPCFRCPERGVG